MTILICREVKSALPEKYFRGRVRERDKYLPGGADDGQPVKGANYLQDSE